MESLKDRVVIVTGSSSGIGAATAQEFARLGAKVTLTGRNEKRLHEAAEACIKVSDKEKILSVQGDLAKDEDIQKIVDQTIEKFGKLHVLVNNAGTVVVGTIETQAMEDIDFQFKVNTRSTIYITKLCIPYLKETKGNIVNVSSVAGLRSSVSMGAYSMTKAAVDMLTKTLSIELGRSGIRVNSVNPGEVRTNIQQSEMGVKDLDEYFAEAASLHPLNRVAEPIELARVITFLASDAASFVSGNITSVDGAQHQTCAYSMIEMDKGLLGQ